MRFSYNWFKRYLQNAPSAQEVYDRLSVTSFEGEGFEEVGGDYVMDFDVLSNRSSDCLSHLGFAREVASVFDLGLVEGFKSDKKWNVDDGRGFSLGDIDGSAVHRYFFLRVDNVGVSDDSGWVGDLLEVIGQRRVNNIVDLSNYIMFSYGNPIHIYDFDKIKGKVGVRYAKEGEKMVLLNGDEIELKEDNLVVCDDEGPISLAGIMGGDRASVTADTRNILIEVIAFNPYVIRRSRQASRLFTEASRRFEAEVIPAAMERSGGIDELLDILYHWYSEMVVGASVSDGEVFDGEKIKVNERIFSRITGRDLDDSFWGVCRRIGCEVDGGVVHTPFYRNDLKITEDLVEEYIRIMGFDVFGSEEIVGIAEPIIDKRFVWENYLVGRLTDDGFAEVMLYNFGAEGGLELRNYVSRNKRFLRENLIDGLLEAADVNAKNAILFGNIDYIKIFEIGVVYVDSVEKLRLGLVAKPLRKKMGSFDFRGYLSDVFGFDVDEFVVGEGDGFVELDLAGIVDSRGVDSGLVDEYFYSRNGEGNVFFAGFSQYPYIYRDVSVWVDDVDRLKSIVNDVLGGFEIVKQVYIFDVFEKDGRVSVAFRIVFQDDNKTLEDGDVEGIMDQLNRVLVESGFEIR